MNGNEKREGETMRYSNNEMTKFGVIKNGYSYAHQCWIENFIIQRCGHPDSLDCQCFGKIHEGEQARFTE
jgi:hypothetical protein